MILSFGNQAITFLMTAFVGIVCGFAFDVLRLFRKFVRHPAFLIQIEDLFFWLFAAVMLFWFLLREVFGEIRFFSLLGTALGMALYFALISPPFMFISTVVLNFLRKVFMTALEIILTPFRLFLRLLSPPARFLRKTIKNILLFIKKLLQKFRFCAKMFFRRFVVGLHIIHKKS